jgi:hypothetical protein
MSVDMSPPRMRTSPSPPSTLPSKVISLCAY